jgi:hypothetical protein
MRLIILLILTLSSILSQAAVYYVSQGGNDNNSGTSISSPWRNISKVNSRSYSPGDQILFERGGVYRGSIVINQSGTSGNPIIISSYGTGEKPILMGSTTPTNWIQHQGSIWKTQVSSRVWNLFCQDQFMTLARYPNTGWLTNDNGSTSQINDAQLTQPSGYWNGSTAVVRSTGWSYDAVTITNYTTGTLNFSAFTSGYNLGSYSWGYFLRNKLSELDVANEWFYDISTQTLYFYPPNGTNPNSLNIEAVTSVDQYTSTGVYTNWQKDWISISNLSFKNYGWAGVHTSGAEYINVIDCEFDHCRMAINAYGSNQIFRNNTITRTLQTSIFSISGPDGGNSNLIEGNSLTDCAIYPGEGESGWGYFGIRATGNNNIIRKNRLTNIGYISLNTSGNNVLIEKNFFDRACSILNDGSAIAFDQTDGGFIQDNIVLSTLGSVESCAANYTGCEPKGKGIYFGNISIKNVTVQNNTVAYCGGAGIWLDHTMVTRGNRILNNTMFGNDLYQFGVTDYSNYNGPGATAPYSVPSYPDQFVTGNIMYCNDPSQKAMYHINRWYSGVDFADFNQNKYINPWDTVNIRVWNIAGTGTNLNYSLSSWRNVRGDDLLSTNTPFLPQSNPEDHIIVYNDSESTSNISLPNGIWIDLDGVAHQGSISLNSFRSKVLYLDNLFQINCTIGIKVFLQGAFLGSNMIDSLRTQNLIPLSDPYTSMGYIYVNGGGSATTPNVLSLSNSNNSIVDWIIVEVRNPSDSSQILYSTSALIQRDGDIVSTDGSSILSLEVAPGQYYISVKHRNHLGVMTNSPINISQGTLLDFGSAPTLGSDMYESNGIRMMWAGDSNFNGVVKYAGSGNDRDLILSRIGGSVPTNTINGYYLEDINMDGTVKYTGNGNDRDVILLTIGGSSPTNTRTSQVP